MKNLTFRATTMLGFGTVIAIFTVIVSICIFELHQIQHGVHDIENDVIPYELLADQMAFDVVQVQQFLTDASATHDRDGFKDAASHAKSFRDGVVTLRQHYADNPEKLEGLQKLAAGFDVYYETGQRMADTYISKGVDAGNEIMKQPKTGFDAVAQQLTVKMSEFRNTEISSGAGRVSAVNVSAINARNVSIVGGLLAVFLGLGIAWRISGNLLGLLGIEPVYAKGIAKEIAKGDLSRDIVVSSGDNSSLLYAMSLMQVRLRGMIREVTSNANAIVGTAEHLADAAQTLLTGSNRQNDAATSVASAVEEMTASIQQIANNADHSDRIAKQAGAISVQGSQVVSDAVDEMNRIAGSVSESSGIISRLGDSSRQISEIVKVIKEIADQTNLLALNAAIEAARAGEQGRGFAVVADEVRKLAARTAQSTQEISTMVDEIQKSASNAVTSMELGTQRVNEGVVKAELAGSSMLQIKEGTEQVVLTVVGITDAIKEQNASVGQVASEVEMIARMVNENTMAVNDLAQTTSKLHELAGALHESISHFKA